ncbi:zinc finger CCCH domain-containing protein 34-like protein [Tanacetum coccineum]
MDQLDRKIRVVNHIIVTTPGVPLDGLKEAYHEPPNLNNGPAFPVDKTNVPCYYYLKGFCSKGDNCSFLHGPAASTVTNEVACEKKLYAATNTGSKPVKSHPDPPESAQIEHTHPVEKRAQDSHQLASGLPEKSEPVKSNKNESDQNVEDEGYVEREENIEDDEFVESEENVKHEEFVQSESDVFDDQSSDGYVEREGWLKSPSGFDVLVEGGSERLGYEKDADYYTVYDEEPRVVNVHYSDYNSAYTKSENALREQRYDVYDRFDEMSEQPRESIFYRLSFQKRNLKPEPILNRRRGSDLREFLKRKVVDGSFFNGYDSNHRIRGNSERHVPRVGIDFDYRARISEVVYMNKHRPPIRDKRLMKPLVLSSAVSRSRKPAQYSNRRSRDESGVFTGPKSLDQIKEEKKKALQGSFNVTESDGFQGPRPLSEILKKKRKLV